MKSFQCIIFCFLFCTTIAQKEPWESPYIDRHEHSLYSVKYGFLKVGSAEIFIAPDFHLIDGEPHYHIQLRMKTAKWLKLFASLDLCFDSYINATDFKPDHGLRIVHLGDDIDEQQDSFIYQDSIIVKTYRVNRNIYYYKKYLLEAHFADLLGTYLYFRSRPLDLSQKENTYLYITNLLHNIEILPHSQLKKYKRYEAILPVEDELPIRKCYIDFSLDGKNHPMKVKLYSDFGNIYFVKAE